MRRQALIVSSFAVLPLLLSAMQTSAEEAVAAETKAMESRTAALFPQRLISLCIRQPRVDGRSYICIYFSCDGVTCLQSAAAVAKDRELSQRTL